MNILVVGNGFDLAHKLPTQYSDFLMVVKSVKNHIPIDIPDFESNGEYLAEFEALINENELIDYFLSIYEKLCKKGKQNWIDFEREISLIVQSLYNLKQVLSKQDRDVRVVSYYLYKLKFFTTKDVSVVRPLKSSQAVDDLANLLLESLNRMIRALEIYLTVFISTKGIKRLKDIQNLSVDHLLSFNYTNTFDLYIHEKINKCFIHGRAVLNHSINDCNLVLGIDEFLPAGTRDNDNEYVWFKKFYQRIYKQTDSSYLDWIDDFSPRTYADINVFIYGHSLDVTDRDVLSKLILAEGVKTHIFYHNKKSLSSQISNLVKIVGEDKLVKMTGGRNRAIEFVPTTE